MSLPPRLFPIHLASSPSTSPLPIHLASSSSTSPLPHPPRLFPIHLASSHPPLPLPHPPCLFPIHLAYPHPPCLLPSTSPLPHPPCLFPIHPRLFPIHLASPHPPCLFPIHLASSPSTLPLTIHLASPHPPRLSHPPHLFPIHLASPHPPCLFPIHLASPHPPCLLPSTSPLPHPPPSSPSTSPLPHPPHLFPIHLTLTIHPRLFPIHLTSYHPPCLFPIHPTSFPPIWPLPHPPRLLLLTRTQQGRGRETCVLSYERTCIECLGALFEHHGRMAGSLFLETMQLFLKALKVQEYRAEILNAMGCVVVGLGTSSSSVQKEIYKSIRTGLGDKSMLVRSAAAKCGIQLAKCSTFLYSQELDAISNSCLKALEGSNYEVRCSVAAFLGTLVSLTQKPLPPSLKGKLKLPSLEEALLILSNGFIRGASMFMKAGGADLLKTGTASREVRVGITQVSVGMMRVGVGMMWVGVGITLGRVVITWSGFRVGTKQCRDNTEHLSGYTTFLAEMGGAWAEKHLPSLISHVLDLAYHTRTTSTHIDAVYSRKCVSFILRFLCGKLLSESAQLIAAKHLCSLVCQRVAAVQGQSLPLIPRDSPLPPSLPLPPPPAAPEKATTILQHLLICSILEVSALVCTLNTAALPLVADENAVDGTGGVASRKLLPF
eukprot:Em0019g765a